MSNDERERGAALRPSDFVIRHSFVIRHWDFVIPEGGRLMKGMLTRRAGLTCLLAAVSCLLPACGWDGHFTILGYTTRPNYDLSIRTVYVPIFKNITMVRGLEFDLTRA